MNGLSRLAEVGELGRQGLSNQAIGERLGLKLSTIQTYMCEARALGMPAPPRGSRSYQQRWQQHIGPEARAALKSQAKARGMTIGQLATALVEAIARDGLIEAVLDDGDKDV